MAPHRHDSLNAGHRQSASSMSTLQSACRLTNGHSEIRENSLEDPGVIDTKSDQINKNEKQIVDECIFIELITYSDGNSVYAYHGLLDCPLEFEALDLGLHSLLVNQALSVHNLV